MPTIKLIITENR